MNKYQRALNEIVENSCPRKTNCHCCDISTRCNSLMKEKIDILQELVKATPKKPTIWGDGYDNKGELIYDMYDCPNCNKTYELDYEKYDYCPNCGQALDWEE